MRKGGRCFVSTFEEGRCGMRDGRCARSDAGYGTVDALYRGCRELAGSDTHCEDEQPAAMASSPSSRQAWGFQVGWGRPGSPCFLFETVVWALWYHVTRNYNPAFRLHPNTKKMVSLDVH